MSFSFFLSFFRIFGFDIGVANVWVWCRPDLETQIERWGLRDVGFGYNIVAVFGSQSTGKSEWRILGLGYYSHNVCVWVGTLLNRLFGTTFDVMDETKRQQTTKGEYSVELY
jgi:hypothetical protein